MSTSTWQPWPRTRTSADTSSRPARGPVARVRPTSCGPGSWQQAWRRQAWQPRHGVQQALRQPLLRPWGLSGATCRMNRRKSCRDGFCDHLFPRVSPAFLRRRSLGNAAPTVHNARHDRRARCFRTAEKRKAGLYVRPSFDKTPTSRRSTSAEPRQIMRQLPGDC